MEQTVQKVTKDMIVSDVIGQYPLAAEIMASYGLSCTGCSANTADSIDAGARSHGMDDEAITQMVAAVNDAISSGKTALPAVQTKGEMTVTDKAAAKMLEILAQQKKAGWGIRINVSAGGCAGYMYGMDFSQKANVDDKVIEKAGAKVFVDPNSARLLGGVTVDYVETLQESGFKFANPNAKGSCGCGQSFH